MLGECPLHRQQLQLTNEVLGLGANGSRVVAGTLASQEVAVKLLPTLDAGQAWQALKRLDDTLSNCQKHTVPWLGSCIWGQELALVMPRYQTNLREHVRGHPEHRLPADAALALAKGLLRGLADVHAAGIVMADLKPNNVMMDEEGRPLLCNVGVMSAVRDMLQLHTAKRMESGSMSYMAPEQFGIGDGAELVTPKTDVWAVGCTLLFAVTGKDPWHDLRPERVFVEVGVKRRAPPIPPPDDIHPDLLELLKNCLHPEPAHRPDAASALESLYRAELFRTVWSSPMLRDHILSFLSPNDTALGVRLMNTDMATCLHGPEHTTAHISQPCLPDEFKRHWSAPGAVRNLTLKQRQHLVSLTAASGVIENLEVAVDAAGCALVGEMMEAPAAAGQLDACIWLHEKGCPTGNALCTAARGGHLDICLTMNGKGARLTALEVYTAARAGKPQLASRLRIVHDVHADQNTKIDYKLLVAAAEGYTAGAFMQLHESWLEGRDRAWKPRVLLPAQRDEVIVAAASSPTPDWRHKVEWLEAKGYPRSDRVACEAARAPNALERIAWLRGRGYRLVCPLGVFWSVGSSSATAAAVLQLMLKENELQPFTADDVKEAAKEAIEGMAEAGRLGELEALHKTGFPAVAQAAASIAMAAALGGHLPVVFWAVEQLGYDITSEDDAVKECFFMAAAESGNMELVEWMAGRWQFGLRLRVEAAVKLGCQRLLEQMDKCGAVKAADPEQLYFLAVCNGDLATLHWLHADHRCGSAGMTERLHERCVEARSPQAALDWLVQAGCPVNDMAVARAGVLNNVLGGGIGPTNTYTGSTS